MGLHDNNLFYVGLCAAALILQTLWIWFPVDGPQKGSSKQNEFLPAAFCCVCTALAAATMFRLFPGNHRPPMEDSSVFIYIGKRMLEGKLPYRDLFDHKGPVLYLIQCLGLRLSHGNTAGIWILEVLNLLAAAVLMLQLGFLTARSHTSAFLAILTVIGVCGSRIWQGGNFTEEYALPWIALGTLVFFRFFKTGTYRRQNIVLLGFSFAVVFLLRANMVAVWAAFLPVVLICFLREHRFPDIWKCLTAFLQGMAVVFLPVLLWAARTGCLTAFWQDYFLFNFSYTGNAAEQEGEILKVAWFFAGVVWPGTAAQIICLASKPKDKIQWLNALFFAASLLAAGISARSYYHYAIILLPAIVLPLTGVFDLTGQTLTRLFKRSDIVEYRLIILSFLFIVTAAFLYRWLSPGDLQEDPVVQILLERTAEEDDVLVLGNNCYYYLAADRKTDIRFFYQIPPVEISDELYKDFVKELDTHPPDFVLLPGGQEEREWTDDRLKGIRGELLNSFYSSEAYDKFELFTRESKPIQQGE